MPDKNKLDTFFENSTSLSNKERSEVEIRARKIRIYKLTLPVIAASIAGLLLIIPSVKEMGNELKLDITRPKVGELEKLHVEEANLYITDKNNKVSNFHSPNIDETNPGSKLVMLTTPIGTIVTKDDNTIDIDSPIGFYDQNNNTIELEQNVTAILSQGMTFNTEKFTYDFNSSYGWGESPITGRGDLGDVDAESFEFYSDNNLLILKGKSLIKINEANFKRKEQ